MIITIKVNFSICFVKFFFWQRWPKDPNYLIVDTDYENYSIVYSCDPNDMQYLWILARTPSISTELVIELLGKARSALPNFDFNNLIEDDQNPDKCKYNK